MQQISIDYELAANGPRFNGTYSPECMDSIMVMSHMLKLHIEHQRLSLLSLSTAHITSRSIWVIVVDYTVENPDIIDVIMMKHNHISHRQDGNVHTFEIRHFKHKSCERYCGINDPCSASITANIYGSHYGGIDVFAQLLMMPEIRQSKSEDDHHGPNIVEARCYLYHHLDIKKPHSSRR